eukprot:TRINITY_DN82179_c0_g1_i1.p1 TRINITY_DN82179_c0_g1~~TRINITY_DN82179_c0_g1_i1.p1  ORF type:complete len:550 (-),score=175.69 TRINITY_DN82179_c0_g1_i1:263-1912(-)
MENSIEEVDVGGLPGVAEELPEANDALPGSKKVMELPGEDNSPDGNDEEDLDMVEALANSGDRASDEAGVASDSLPGAEEQEDFEENVDGEDGEEAHENGVMDVEEGAKDAEEGMVIEDETVNPETSIQDVAEEGEEQNEDSDLHEQDLAPKVLDENEKDHMISEPNATSGVKEEMEEGLTEQQSDAPVVEMGDESLASRRPRRLTPARHQYDELRVMSFQISEFLSTLDGSLKDMSATAMTPEKGKVVSGKRARKPTDHSYPNEKRLEVQLNPEMRACQKVLNALVRRRDLSWPFLDPVNPKTLQIPDYFYVVKFPMDLGTVETKLKHGMYADYDAFGRDVRQSLENCMMYNVHGSDIWTMAQSLMDFFDKKFKSDVISKLAQLRAPPVVSTPSSAKRSRSRDSLEKTTIGSETKKKKGPGKRGRKPKKAKKSTSEEAGEDEVTFEEKRELTQLINQLDAGQLEEVARIVAPKISEGDEEIEIDINTLSTETLRELQLYVQAVTRPIVAPQPPAMTQSFFSQVPASANPALAADLDDQDSEDEGGFGV